jgi:hypothetical protein
MNSRSLWFLPALLLHEFLSDAVVNELCAKKTSSVQQQDALPGF